MGVKGVTVIEEEGKDNNINYFGANFCTSNHITFSSLDEIKRLAFFFVLLATIRGDHYFRKLVLSFKSNSKIF